MSLHVRFEHFKCPFKDYFTRLQVLQLTIWLGDGCNKSADEEGRGPPEDIEIDRQINRQLDKKMDGWMDRQKQNYRFIDRQKNMKQDNEDKFKV